MNMFLVEVLGSDSNSASQAHSKDLAAAQKPHVISAIVRGPAGHCDAAQLKLFLSDLERHDGVVTLLDDGPLDNEFDRCQTLSTFRVFPESDAEQLAALGPGQLDGATLTGLDLLGDTPIVEAIGLGFQKVDDHVCLLCGLPCFQQHCYRSIADCWHAACGMRHAACGMRQ